MGCSQMDNPSNTIVLETIRARFDNDICFLQIYRPDAGNSINDRLIEECSRVLDDCDSKVKILVLEGLPDVFCFGVDFQEIGRSFVNEPLRQDAEQLYNIWEKLASGSYVTVAHVRGKVNAGGVGFVAACDIVLCEEKAVFSLSELLFGLMPACVLPFLVRRIGYAKANYMTLMTQPIPVRQAYEWGLVDAYERDSKTYIPHP